MIFFEIENKTGVINSYCFICLPQNYYVFTATISWRLFVLAHSDYDILGRHFLIRSDSSCLKSVYSAQSKLTFKSSLNIFLATSKQNNLGFPIQLALLFFLFDANFLFMSILFSF